MITLPGRLFLLFQALVLVLAATTCNAAKHKDGGVIAYVVDWVCGPLLLQHNPMYTEQLQ